MNVDIKTFTVKTTVLAEPRLGVRMRAKYRGFTIERTDWYKSQIPDRDETRHLGQKVRNSIIAECRAIDQYLEGKTTIR